MTFENQPPTDLPRDLPLVSTSPPPMIVSNKTPDQESGECVHHGTEQLPNLDGIGLISCKILLLAEQTQTWSAPLVAKEQRSARSRYTGKTCVHKKETSDRLPEPHTILVRSPLRKQGPVDLIYIFDCHPSLPAELVGSRKRSPVLSRRIRLDVTGAISTRSR
jgi:hypothetical protein